MAFKHGLSSSVEYRVWADLKQRCINQRCGTYKYYGGRGIKVSEEWLDFKRFYNDMGPRPSCNHTLDRMNNDGNYEKSNCRWATQAEQNLNKSNSRMITHNNKTQTLTKWANETGLNRYRILARINRGKSIEEALSITITKSDKVNKPFSSKTKFKKLFTDKDNFPKHTQLENVAGQRYDKLVAIRLYGISENNHSWWWFKCDCGIEKPMKLNAVKTHFKNTGKTTCGCSRKEAIKNNPCFKRKTHGLSNTKEHRTWRSIRTRCTNKKDAAYFNYGGRGIKICERWNSFENFLSDMGFAPNKSYTIDRINVNGDYEPLNCRWTTRQEQSNNRRNCRYLTVNGITKTLSQWSKNNNICRSTLEGRINMGWTPENIVSKGNNE
jgi:hypothetical protein